MHETVYWLYYRDDVQMISIKRFEVGGPKIVQFARFNNPVDRCFEYISVPPWNNSTTSPMPLWS